MTAFGWARTGRRRGRLLPSLVAASLVLVPAVAWAQDAAELEDALDVAEQEANELGSALGGVRSDVTEAEEELAAIAGRLADARARLGAAEGQVALAEAAVTEAREAEVRAVEQHERSKQRLAAAERKLAEEEALLTEQIISTFKYGTAGATRGAAVLDVLRRAEDPNAYAVGMKQLQVVVDDQDTTVARVFELRGRRTERSQEAERARGRAAQASAEAGDVLVSLEKRREEAAAVAAEITVDEQRQATLLDSLKITEEETRALLARAEARRAEIQDELNAQRAREEAARQAREDAARAAAARAEAQAREQAREQASEQAPERRSSGAETLGGLACPVVGAVAGRDFSNDWGYPRSGGRRHEGSDMFAVRGTPVVAVADGTVVRVNPPGSQTGLGGITVTYRTADGSEWYNAHLHSLAAGISAGAQVARGQAIGTVGNTGNAAGTPPHLHLGRYVNGGAVNPWPTTSGVCR